MDISPVVSVCTAGEVSKHLQVILRNLNNPHISRVRTGMAFKKAVSVWLPLKWEIIFLFMETVECEHQPLYVTSADGKVVDYNGMPCTGSGRKPIYQQYPSCICHSNSKGCGWPFRKFPANFDASVKALHAKVVDLREAEKTQGVEWGKQRCCKWRVHSSPGSAPCSECEPVILNRNIATKGSLSELLDMLGTCAQSGPSALSGRQVGLCRSLLAGCNTKRGLPGTYRFNKWWSTVEACVGEGIEAVVGEVFGRLSRYDQSRGLGAEVIESVVAKCQGRSVPNNIRRKITRARLRTLKELLDVGLVPSAEIVAQLVPALTAEAASTGVSDLALRRISYALRVAFRKRRSLLLLNLDRQVRIQDIPWAPAIVAYGADNISESGVAFSTLKLVVSETLNHFPQTIIPNKLLQSLRDLAKEAGMYLPLTDELAADIFTGSLTKKFADAVSIAAEVLVDSPYARYYGLNDIYRAIRNGEAYSPEKLVADCGKLSRLGPCQQWIGWGSVAKNGAGLEWCQILSSQNLAGLYRDTKIADEVEWGSLASRTWLWILQALSKCPMNEWRPKLQHMKNIAFAWRQLIFFVSMVSGQERRPLLNALDAKLRDCVNDPTSYTAVYHIFLGPLRKATTSSLLLENRHQPIVGWIVERNDQLDRAVSCLSADSTKGLASVKPEPK